jgi:TRAP-type uncharacterized transport system fused permease subunit
LQDELKDNAGEREKLEELLAKDTAARKPAGVWSMIVAVLGASMVFFYFYTAGITSVATQYHRGVYVFLTYILVFLLYPARNTPVRLILNLFLGAVLSCAAGAFIFFEDVGAFHQRLMLVHEGFSDGGISLALSRAAGLWPLAAGTLAIAAGLTVADDHMTERWPKNPPLSDILLALVSAGPVYYWIHEFENLNYRAGAETELDALVSIVGVLLSIEVCRRVLG